jgi:RNA polymerase sigma-70 factor (ECF subfamily)
LNGASKRIHSRAQRADQSRGDATTADPGPGYADRSGQSRFEDGDVDTVVALLTDDALLTMPPYPYQCQGGAAIGNFVRVRGARHETPLRLVPTGANGQPAFGCYFPTSRARKQTSRARTG